MPYQLQVPPVAEETLLAATEEGLEDAGATDEVADDDGADDERGAALELALLLAPLKCVAKREVALMPLVLLIR